jgi:uncharacterized protein YceH (UPF0502 family)
MNALADALTGVLSERGALVGAELREAVGAEGYALWKQCMLCDEIVVERVGRRYLRLDRKVEGYARLSPSILREFLTYCVVGLAERCEEITARKDRLAAHIATVSAAKRRLAERIVGEVGARLLPPGSKEEDRFCVLLAGDIVYGMGHDAPRSEKSTGQMVRGSDLDLIVITRDDAPQELTQLLDDAIYKEKYRHLNNPAFKEEIDYVVKPLERVREQSAFDTFKHMVSCKILNEAELLYGSPEIWTMVGRMLRERGIGDKLAEMERVATQARRDAERRLLEMDDSGLVGDELYLFHTSEETEEFE